uniref:long-chain-fatty-acid--CoA ligase n=1 Tax=Geotrypetes seraphini TaxID=260995 RepID=A0A6P8PXT8_GEOSA|nr:long-chain-fatty-acid--CoA ligase ACSBG2-like isoform X3 [Geotrypetes seraphini]
MSRSCHPSLCVLRQPRSGQRKEAMSTKISCFLYSKRCSFQPAATLASHLSVLPSIKAKDVPKQSKRQGGALGKTSRQWLTVKEHIGIDWTSKHEQRRTLTAVTAQIQKGKESAPQAKGGWSWGEGPPDITSTLGGDLALVAQGDFSIASKLAPADNLWTTERDGAVRLRMGQTGPEAEPPITIHQLFQQTLERYSNRPALAVKRDGQWKTTTYLEYYQACRAAAKGFLKVQSKLPHLKAIIQYHGELKEKRPNLYMWKEFMQLGSDVLDSQLDEIIAPQKANQCCTLIYTSGTTGNPKGVMLSHDNMTWSLKAFGNALGVGEDEVMVSYLPLSHIAAQVYDIWLPITFGGITYFAEPDALKGSLITTLQEVRPTVFIGVPRVWEKIQEELKNLDATSSIMRKKTTAQARAIGLRANYNHMNGNNSVPWGYTLAHYVVLRKIQEVVGLDRCHICNIGAAPTSKDIFDYFMSINLPLHELYGMSESTGAHVVSTSNSFLIPSCGKELLGCKIRIDKPDKDGNGEVCYWGRDVFMGYLNMKEKTLEALDEEGWLHSGDIGKLDQHGFLYITGRIKELIITSGGENIPPSPIENSVKEEVPIISNAMVIGDERKFLSLLITLKCNIDRKTGEPQDELNLEAVQFCQELGSRATRVSEVIGSKDPVIYKAIQEGIERVNERAVSNAQKIQKWTILDKDFSVVGGEIGPTMKLRRHIVLQLYQDTIDAFYK